MKNSKPKKITERGYKIMQNRAKNWEEWCRRAWKHEAKLTTQVMELKEKVSYYQNLVNEYQDKIMSRIEKDIEKTKARTEDIKKQTDDFSKYNFNDYSDLERPSIVETIDRTSRRLTIKRIAEIAFDGTTHEFRSIAFRRVLEVAQKIVNDKNIDLDQIFVEIKQKENRDKFWFYIDNDNIDPTPYKTTETFWPYELETKKS